MVELENIFSEKVGNYGLRRCSIEDLKKVISINLITLPENYSDYFFEDLLKSSPESFIVAEKNDEIVGYIMCRIEYGFSNFKRFNLSRKGHIVSLAVLENHRGNKLGKSLISSAVNALKLKGCNEAYLEVRATNDEAVAIYKQLGFKITSVISGYYRDNEKANLMGIQLMEQK